MIGFSPSLLLLFSRCVRFFATPWTMAHQASLSFTISRSLLKLISIEWVMPFIHPSVLSSVTPFSPARNHSQNQDLFQSPSLASCLKGCYAVWLPSGKESTCQYRRLRRHGSVSGLRRFLGAGNSNLLQYSCLENPKDRGAWQLQSRRCNI